MTSRATVARLRKAVRSLSQNQRPLAIILEPSEGESPESWGARKAEAERKVQDAKAAGRRAHLLIIDLAEDA